ncbi:MAG: radical SAM protein [Clostridia bacterium]|nr:radical SAM protein [Clostridia bacterium]
MNGVLLMYPPGKMYQRGEDRAQCNVEESVSVEMRACNDLGYAAAILREKGYDVLLRDYQTEKKDAEYVKNEILAFRPKMIVISVTYGTVVKDLEYARGILSFYECLIVLKGAAFFDPEPKILHELDLEGIRCMIGGEMSFIIGPLADCLLRGEGNLAQIPGISWYENGELKKTDFCTFHENVDELPFPARDLMNNTLYKRPDTGEPMATIQISYGCPSGCIYCLTPMLSGRKVRFRSIENIFSEIEECYYKYHIRHFFFKADTFTIDRERAIGLCDRIIHSPLCGKISFTVNSRTDTLSPQLCAKLKKAGCFMVAVGFESGSDETLRRIGKHADTEKSREAMRMLREAGLPVYGFFMVGFPWETEADIRNTFDFALRLRPDYVEIHTAMPYYGTGLYTECEKLNTIEGSSFGFDYIAPNTKGTAYVDLARIERLKKQFLLRFHSDPAFLRRIAVQCASEPSKLGHYLYYGVRLLKNIVRNHSGKGRESR